MEGMDNNCCNIDPDSVTMTIEPMTEPCEAMVEISCDKLRSLHDRLAAAEKLARVLEFYASAAEWIKTPAGWEWNRISEGPHRAQVALDAYRQATGQ